MWRTPLLVIALLAASCDWVLRFSIDGLWQRGGVPGDHFGNYYLTVSADRDEITGRACYISDTHIIFRDAPVRGYYPSLEFTVAPGTVDPCCQHLVGVRFVGRITRDGTIVGHLGPANGVTQRITFRRSAGAPPSGCFTAK